MDNSYIFAKQGFAAGLMLSISFFDLAHNAINSIGFLKGNLWVRPSKSSALFSLLSILFINYRFNLHCSFFQV